MLNLAVYLSKYVFVFISFYFQYYNFKFIYAAAKVNKHEESVLNDFFSKSAKNFDAELIYNADRYAGRQFTLLCLFHAIACGILKEPLFGAAAMAYFIAAFFCVRPVFGKGCRILWNNVFFLMDIGFIMLLRINPSSAQRQFMWFGLGFAGALACRFVIRQRKTELIKPSVPFPRNHLLIPIFDSTQKTHKTHASTVFELSTYFFIALTPALLVLPFFIGVTINGATNWVSFYGYSFQPSEIAKISFTLGLAGMLCIERLPLRRALFICAFSALCVLILVLQRDLGGALIFFAVFLIMLYAATRNKPLVLIALLLASFAAVAAYFIFPHVRVRVTAWVDPWSDISGSGYQIIQSLFAIGTWGPMGSGLTLGKPGFIPVVESDFIFAAITEEFGVFFTVSLICSFTFILHFGLRAARLLSDRKRSLAAIGLSAMLAFQAFLIMGGCIRLVPITGVTLPFISYGGSSIVVCLTIIGMLSCLAGNSKPLSNPYSQIEKLMNTVAPTPVKSPTRAYYLLYLPYLLVIVFLLKFVFLDSEGVTANSYNPRMRVSDTEITRGNIYDRNMRVLAANEESLRIYPYAEKTAHIVGYLARGGAGAESRYNFELQKPSAETYQRILNAFTGEPLKADSIVLTIDAELNALIYDRLTATGFKGAAAVIEPSTGRMLALVSNPGYDPNNISELWSDLSSDEKNSPLINRATQGLYPPGSIFKVITATAAIAAGENESFDCSGEAYFENGVRMRCFNQNVHGILDLAGAFRVSCNGYFADIGIKVGAQAIQGLAGRAMFDASLEFPLSYRQSSFVLGAGSEINEIVQTAIGQGKTLVSPLHMAMITAAVANGGIMMQPYILDHIQSNGKQYKKTIPQKLTDAFTLDEASLLTDMMVGVVNNGTGTASAISGLKVAGKTGTAENSAGDDHGWYIAFAPADNPKVALAILLENSGGPRQALLIAKEIIEYVLNS